MSAAGHTEFGNFRFRVKEGVSVGDLFIDAEPQSETGGIPGGLKGMGFTLYTDDIEEAQRIADFLNDNVHQIFMVTHGGETR